MSGPTLTFVDVRAMVARDPEAMLTPGQVATLLRVDPKTVTRWCNAGRVRSIRTPGGHRRILAASILTSN